MNRIERASERRRAAHAHAHAHLERAGDLRDDDQRDTNEPLSSTPVRSVVARPSSLLPLLAAGDFKSCSADQGDRKDDEEDSREMHSPHLLPQNGDGEDGGED